MPESSQQDDIEIILATARPYFDLPIGDLELLFEGSLDEMELNGLPHRGTSDRSSWLDGPEPGTGHTVCAGLALPGSDPTAS